MHIVSKRETNPSLLFCSTLIFSFLVWNTIAGDEILAVNDESLVGLSHAEAIAVFKRIKSGDVVLTIARRATNK